MSDGPYRSLPMSTAWRRLAEFCENQNFEPADIRDVAIKALESDWRDGVPEQVLDDIRSLFLDPQGDLFAQQRIDRLEALRRSTAGHGIARLFLDCAAASFGNGGSGVEALAEVGTNTLLTRASRGMRQVEEHYFRSATTALATSVRSRLEEACRTAPVESLARDLLKVGPRVQRESSKHFDLDDGVSL